MQIYYNIIHCRSRTIDAGKLGGCLEQRRSTIIIMHVLRQLRQGFCMIGASSHVVNSCGCSIK